MNVERERDCLMKCLKESCDVTKSVPYSNILNVRMLFELNL